MRTIIALLRGINVGGRNKLPMRDLVTVLEDLGLTDVKTYIQSGNAVFHADGVDSEELSDAIRATIQERHGFTPQVLLLGLPELAEAMASNPFPEAEAEPKSLHLYFLASAPADPNLDSLADIQLDSEEFALEGPVFYLYAPGGIGRSKLAAKVEKAMGVPVTARNWRSVGKILEMAQKVDGIVAE